MRNLVLSVQPSPGLTGLEVREKLQAPLTRVAVAVLVRMGGPPTLYSWWGGTFFYILERLRRGQGIGLIDLGDPSDLL